VAGNLLFIPAFNCERQITRVLAQLDERALKQFREILVLDNRSTDGTVRAASDYIAEHGLPARVCVNRENYSLGGSHKVAFNYALEHGFEYVVVLHGDDQAKLADLLPHLEAGAHVGCDALLGSRFMRGSRLEGYSLLRTVGNRVFNVAFSLAARRWLTDLGSGLNLYRVGALQDRFYLGFADDLTFNYYMILAGCFLGFKQRFFPLVWVEEDQRSNVKMVRQATKMVRIVSSFLANPRAFVYGKHTSRRDYSTDVVFP
jgi:glycosyltransferase involved in cell wall biosynthesis